jgi:hypothetical protein
LATVTSNDCVVIDVLPQHRVEVSDLAEAVAAELQRLRHETEAPLPDVERRAAVVVDGRVAVGHHHLGERHPVCHRTIAVAVLISHVCSVMPSR